MIQDVELNQSKLGEEHDSVVQAVEREWKEKMDKSKNLLQGEIDFLDSSITRQVTIIRFNYSRNGKYRIIRQLELLLSMLKNGHNLILFQIKHHIKASDHLTVVKFNNKGGKLLIWILHFRAK